MPVSMIAQDSVTFSDIAGLSADGEIPARFSEECRAALAAADRLLATRGLSLHGIFHIACAIRDADAFAQCQNLIGEAIGPARPSVTLRVVHRLERAEQRIAIGVAAYL